MKQEHLESVLASLPRGAGLLDFELTSGGLEGFEHGRKVFVLQNNRADFLMPEAKSVNIDGLTSVLFQGPWLYLDFPEEVHKVHAGVHAAQLSQLFEKLLVQRTKDVQAYEAMLAKAEEGNQAAMEYVQEALRTGRGVDVNENMADVWKSRIGQTKERTKPMESNTEAQKRLQEEEQAGLKYEQAEKSGPDTSPEGLFEAAQKYLDVKDDESHIRLLKEAAEKNHPQATYQLAAYAAHGSHGVKEDAKQSFELMKKAKELGDKSASYYLGSYLRQGFGTPKDAEAAIRAYEEDGTPKSLAQIALIYGEDLKDYPKAIQAAEKAMDATKVDKTKEVLEKRIAKWRQAQEEESSEAKKSLHVGKVLMENGEAALAKDFLEAAQELREAKYLLGVLYAKGDGIDQDKEKAKELLTEAASGFPDALYYLIYLEEDPKKQLELAKQYLQTNGNKAFQDQVKALVDSLDPESLFEKALALLETGDEAGTDLLIEAAEAGSQQAAAVLAKALEESDPAGAKYYQDKLNEH